MKKLILSLIICLTFAGSMLAQLPNDFIMHGQVTRTSDNSAVANHLVLIYEQLNNPSTLTLIDSVYTNVSGIYYEDIVNGSTIGANRTFLARVYDCQNAAHDQTAMNNQGTTDYAELNFQICDFNNTCQAGFEVIQNPNQWNSIYFSNQSTLSAGTITSWSWSYGDGTGQSSPQPNISSNHVYTNAGAYVACFTITTSEGCTSSICDTVVVTSPCQNAASIVNQANPGSQAFFGYATWNGQIINNATYTWSWGDGNTTAGGPTTQHQYAQPGIYNVCVTINYDNCTSTACQSVTITSPCNGAAGFVNQTATNDLNFVGYATWNGQVVNNANFVWFWADSTTSTGGPTVSHDYAVAGVYNICVSVTYNGCSDTYCHQVTMGNPPACSADFSYTQANIPYSYYVSPVNQGGQWLGSYTPNPNGLITFPGPGTYQLCYIMYMSGDSCDHCETFVVGNGSGSCQAGFIWTANPNGLTAFNNNSDSNNNGTIVSYAWNFGDGTSSGDQNPAPHQYNANTTHVVCLTITTSNGCTSTFCDTVGTNSSNNGCQAAFNWYPGTSVLSGTNIIFHNNSDSNGNGPITSYAWNFGDNHTGIGQNPDHTYQQPGWYLVCLTITTQNGCSSTYCDSVSIAPANVPCQASFTTTYSPFPSPNGGGGVYVFNSTSDSTLEHQWNINGAVVYGPNVTYTFITPGTYQVCLTVWSNSGCQDTECHSIIVAGDSSNAVPCQASFAYHAAPNNLLEYTFESTSDPNLNQVWTINGQTFTGLNIYYNFPGPGTYQVCLAVSGDSCYDSECEVIYVGTQDSTVCNASFTFFQQNSAAGGYHFQSTSSHTLIHNWVIDNDFAYTGYDFNYTLAPGTHVVCLTVYNNNGCQDTECQTIVVGTDSSGTCNSTISGNVSYADVNCSICVNDAIALLYQLTASDSGTVATLVDVTLVAQGGYSFSGVCNGNYIVQAMVAPNSPNYMLYMPTYSFSQPQWINSPVINVTSNSSLTTDVSLIPVSNPGGSGTIGGGINIPGDTVRAMGPIQGIKVYLTTLGGSYVTYTFTDANGNFTLGNLPYGTYNLCADYPGFITDCQQITIDANNPTITDVQFDFNQITIGIKEEETNVTVGNLYPNPANSETFMNIELAKSTRLNVSIINTVGQVVYSQSLNLQAGKQLVSIPLANLAQGLYTLSIISNSNNKPITKKLLKY